MEQAWTGGGRDVSVGQTGLGLATMAVGMALAFFAATAAYGVAPEKPAELFEATKVWTIHLRFTPEQWQAMEPSGGGRGFFGGGGPGGGGGPRGGGFGPGMFVAPVLLGHGDADKDGTLSKEEFGGLAGRWFEQWDKEKRGQLSNDQLRTGLNGAFAPPGGAQAVRGPGINLQGAEGRRNGLASAAGIEFKYVHADLEFEGQVVKDVGVRYKGNGTWMQSQGSAKRSLKVDVNEWVKGQKFAGVTGFNLHSNVTDASSMNEPLSHRLYRDAGVVAPRTAYAKVYVTVPGKHERAYLGLYSVIEDVDKAMFRDLTGNKGGAILKPVTPSLFDDLGDDWAKYKQTYDPKTDLSEKQIRRVIEFCRLVTKADDAGFAAKVGDYLDLDRFARYMAVTVWLSTLDSVLGMGQNFYVYLNPKTDKFEFVPWDLDHSFGQFPIGFSQADRENLSIRKPWRGDVRLLERVFKVEAFSKRYLATMAEFSGTIFKPERFHRQVDEVAAAIRPAVAEESAAKLERFDKVVAGEAVSPAPMGGFGPGARPGSGGDAAVRAGGAPAGGAGAGGPPGPGGPPPMFAMAPVKPIKGFVDARAKSVLDQIAGKSEGQVTANPFGGRQQFQPGNFLAPAFMGALDGDKDGQLTREEFVGGFAKWAEAWDADKGGGLTDEELRAGINKDLAFRPAVGGPPGGQRAAPAPAPAGR